MFTARKVSVFGVFLVRVFLHSDQKNSEYGHLLRSGCVNRKERFDIIELNQILPSEVVILMPDHGGFFRENSYQLLDIHCRASHSLFFLGHLEKSRIILHYFLDIFMDTAENNERKLELFRKFNLDLSCEKHISKKASRTKTNFALFKGQWEQIPFYKF